VSVLSNVFTLPTYPVGSSASSTSKCDVCVCVCVVRKKGESVHNASCVRDQQRLWDAYQSRELGATLRTFAFKRFLPYYIGRYEPLTSDRLEVAMSILSDVPPLLLPSEIKA
jgi:hypothetical protein